MIKGKYPEAPDGEMLTEEDYIEKEEMCDGCKNNFPISTLKKDGSDHFCPGCLKLAELEEVEYLIDQTEDALDAADKEWYESERYKEFQERAIDGDFNAITESYTAFCENRSGLVKLSSELNRKKRMLMPAVARLDIPHFGKIFSLQDFVECVESGGFIDYDGYGNYILGDKMTDIEIYPSDVKNKCIRTEFEKIIWFNR